jgi:hypothetical protein
MTATVLGHSIPRRFRGWWLHLENPVLVLREFVAWLEAADNAAVTAERGWLDASSDECRQYARERAMLVAGLIELGDLLESPALQHRVTMMLATVGVTPVDSTGERFDPARHRAVDRVATSDPRAAGRVAETERLGYRDRDRDARLPDVLVYHHEDRGTP